MTQHKHIFVLLVGLLYSLASSGCTFSDGTAYGEVAATVEARYDERTSGSGWERLLGDVEIRLVEVELRDVVVEMVDEANHDDDDASDEPAHCHGADCESDEPAESSGGAVALSLTAGNLDLLDNDVSALSCAESCRLPRGHVSAIHLTATRLVVRGKVRDRLPTPRLDGEVPFSASFTLDAVSLERAIDLPLDDDHDSIIDMKLQLPLDAALFDPVPFATTALAPDGTLQLEREQEVIAGLRERFSARDIGVVIERSPAD